MKIKNTIISILQKDITAAGCDVIVNPAKEQLSAIDEAGLRKVCVEAFKEVDNKKAHSLGLAALAPGAGDAKFPVIGAAKIMAQEILRYLRNPKTTLKEIAICTSDKDMFEIFNKHVTGYIKHIQDDLSQGPYVTVDAIIELPEGIILIERSNPPFGWALPGGFLDYGESLEEAVIREAKEETDMDLEDLRQFHTYSKPGRDPRFNTVSTVFVAKGKGTPKSGDDAKGLKVVKYENLLKLNYAFDHKQVIEDYLKSRKS